MLMYAQVFQILKNKIESGLLPEGSSLPSRADLCADFGISEKTIRRALALLEENGLIVTAQRKRPIVRTHENACYETTGRALQKIETVITNDVLKTGVLICYPLIKNGISLCTDEDLKIPRQMLENMKAVDDPEFFKLSKRFWRYFVARNENDLSLRTVDSLGIAELTPVLNDSFIRAAYYRQLKQFMRTIESGGAPESVHFDDMSKLYGVQNGGSPVFKVASDALSVLISQHPSERLSGADIKYSTVYMDILGLIAIGRYRPGDRLPTHKELQKTHGVCVNTTLKAVQILQEMGVVKTVRGSGIFVQMNLDALKTIRLSPRLIACHVRRYLDSLELLALTVEGAAACAAPRITKEEIRAARAEINRLWNEEYLYERSPALLLDFITEHIGIDALKEIYQLLQKNFKIGRSIPALLNVSKTAVNSEIHDQCLKTLDELYAGSRQNFAVKVAQLFKKIYNLVIDECKKLNYYGPAMKIYDGAALWK